MKEALLSRQLPDAEEAQRRAHASLQATENSSAIPVADSGADTCGHCPHITGILPLELDLRMMPCGHHHESLGYQLCNPVHSLHLNALLDSNGTASTRTLLGMEQEKRWAAHTPGLVDTWHVGLLGQVADELEVKRDAATVKLKAEKQDTVGPSSEKRTLEPPTLQRALSKKDDIEVDEADLGHFKTISSAASPNLESSVEGKKKEEEKAPPTPSMAVSEPAAVAAASQPAAAASTSDLVKLPEPQPSATTTTEPTALSANPAKEEEGIEGDGMKCEHAQNFAAIVNDHVRPSWAISPPDPENTQSSDPAAPSNTAHDTGHTKVAAVAQPPMTTTQPTFARPLLPPERLRHLEQLEAELKLGRRALGVSQPRSSTPTPSASKKTTSTTSSTMTEQQKQRLLGPHYFVPTDDHRRHPHQEQDRRLQQLAWAKHKAELWLEHYRGARERYWRQRQEQQHMPERLCHKRARVDISDGRLWTAPSMMQPFGAIVDNRMENNSMMPVPINSDKGLLCAQCADNHHREQQPRDDWVATDQLHCRPPTAAMACHDDADDMMQCLDCGMVACGPAGGGAAHIFQHFLLTGHSIAVTCGAGARLFCFACGDYCSLHPVFEQELERIDLSHRLPWFGWDVAPLQRSFDAFQFMRIKDQGVFWRGAQATYPVPVSDLHLASARASMLRCALMDGDVPALPALAGEHAKLFAAQWQMKPQSARWRISMPVGMYNLGNSCYMSSVLQCLIHCAPLQKYFLRDVGHHYESCEMFRNQDTSRNVKSGSKTTLGICIACELDRLFLSYFGSTIGNDFTYVLKSAQNVDVKAISASKDSKQTATNAVKQRGRPLLTNDILTANWRCGAMDHLAGYAQRDAHEFFHAFLDVLGKHVKQFRERIRTSLSPLGDSDPSPVKGSRVTDVVKQNFEGALRSVLICEECGTKRAQTEHFVSISLPLARELEGQSFDEDDKTSQQLSVERCLRHFTLPEALSDPVDCPSCGKKTRTKKQHVVSHLPRILCLHLKRFDAARNRKIEDFVSFPARNLSMGPFLPHWREVTRVKHESNGVADAPQVKYDLFGTVNHYGTINSGHYVANLKVDKMWYHCNDAWVCKAGDGDGEAEVLQSHAYLLYYVRV